jgi:hypothetical protein
MFQVLSQDSPRPPLPAFPRPSLLPVRFRAPAPPTQPNPSGPRLLRPPHLPTTHAAMLGMGAPTPPGHVRTEPSCSRRGSAQQRELEGAASLAARRDVGPPSPLPTFATRAARPTQGPRPAPACQGCHWTTVRACAPAACMPPPLPPPACFLRRLRSCFPGAAAAHGPCPVSRQQQCEVACDPLRGGPEMPPFYARRAAARADAAANPCLRERAAPPCPGSSSHGALIFAPRA